MASQSAHFLVLPPPWGYSVNVRSAGKGPHNTQTLTHSTPCTSILVHRKLPLGTVDTYTRPASLSAFCCFSFDSKSCLVCVMHTPVSVNEHFYHMLQWTFFLVVCVHNRGFLRWQVLGLNGTPLSKPWIVVCWLLIVPAICECISGTDLHRQFYVLPHWDRSCRSNFPSHPVTVYWHRADQSQCWPYNARRLAG